MVSLPMQQIDGKCVDQRKLMSLLRTIYGISNEGRNNFYVELRLNKYKIYRATDSPALTEAEIRDCRTYRRLL
ncbi:uncharacterized protein ASPGLDRAFT_44892 [Aspergillus glaucus CBS 516.65]|uniref:Uncharacterized protein n=1 Tax=Aspergillus glaucus CBS 516.65 TaxID=1160497 RepID=A0A1L9VPW2_ASPGL|nr:hypothetical protein ASPGLDRAFT_44892 [Aspergillus glaucus CBS 516.65]OJJ85920.1 hypothetical protein ASPGLDRAFT_44892 [Aspergillus glaucus CBS 516.65]